MTASRRNQAGRAPTPPRLPLALHECFCADLSLPHRHQLGDHDTDLADVAAVMREQQRQRAIARVRHINRAVTR